MQQDLRFHVVGIPGRGSAPEGDGQGVAWIKEHGLGSEVATGGAPGHAHLVVRVTHDGGRAGDTHRPGKGGALRRAEVPLVNVLAQGLAGDGLGIHVQHALAFQFAEDGVNAAGAVHVLNMIIR